MISKQKKIKVIPDLHGNYQLLELVLSDWNKEKEFLVFLGDLIDRGPNSLKIVRKVMKLVNNNQAICIRGNHEEMFLYFMRYGKGYIDYLSPYVGGMDFIENMIEELINDGYKEEYLGQLDNLLPLILKKYADVIQFFIDMPLYVETEHILFVHGGITPYVTTIEEMKDKDFVWGEPLYYRTNHSYSKLVISGHYPTKQIHQTHSDIYISENKKTMIIDGGACFAEKENSFHFLDISIGNKYINFVDNKVYLYLNPPILEVNKFRFNL